MTSNNPGGAPNDPLERLEQKLARSRNFTVVLAVALVVSVLWTGTMNGRITRIDADLKRLNDTASIKDFVRARQFEVVDKAGRVTAVLTTLGSAGAMVTMNAQGKSLVEIASTTDGEGMIIAKNADGQPVASMGALASGEGFVTTSNGVGNELVRLGAVNGHGTVTTKNSQGTELIHLGVTTGGDGLAYTANAQGQRLVEFGATGDRMSGTIVVYSVAGGAIYSINSDDKGAGVVRILDGHGNGQAQTALQFQELTE